MTLRRGRRRLRLRQFRALARTLWAQIPDHFRASAHLLVHPEAEWDPDDPSILLLGMCESPTPGAPEQSRIHLWYGSFVLTAERARRFHWRGELEETILHELTHHWEHRAGLDHLDRFDRAQWQNFQRRRGESVPWGFWRGGVIVGEGRWEIDGDLFVEMAGAPPWTPLAGDGKQVRCAPAAGRSWAVVPRRGAVFDGLRGDLVVAPAPAVRGGRIRALLNRLRGSGC